jgi:TatD DNase family protein
LTVRFIDSHAHLADPAFDSDRAEVIARAQSAGAEAVICIGESVHSASRARALASANAGLVYFTAGIHPHDAQSFEPSRDTPQLEELIQSGARAIGECGLDYHYDNSPREAQRVAFEAQIELAHRSGLPLVVHTRDAEYDTRTLLLSAARRNVIGVLHCYTGSVELAEAALESGWYISFSGIITFKNWNNEALLRLVPDDRLLVESDSPYLAPVPNRGKRNEPAWVVHTMARLALARQSSPATIASIVSMNARRFFALGASA